MPDAGCARPLMGRLIETVQMHSRNVICSIDRIEIRGEGFKPDIGPRLPVTGREIALYLDGEKLNGWESFTLTVLPNQMVKLDLRLPSNVTVECPDSGPARQAL